MEKTAYIAQIREYLTHLRNEEHSPAILDRLNKSKMLLRPEAWQNSVCTVNF